MKKDGFLINLKNKYFTLTNKYFYWGVFIVLIGIFTSINNYGFYSYAESSSKKAVRQFKTIILSIIDNYPNEDKEKIQKLIIDIATKWEENSHYNNGIELKLLNNEIKILKETENCRTGSKFIIDIKKLLNEKEDWIKIDSNLTVFNTVIKSMTFSLYDIYDDIFHKYTAPFDGKVFIEDGERKIKLVIKGNDDEKVQKLNPYSDIIVRNGINIKKDDLLAKGSIHVAINKINTYWYRSRIAICFAIFIYLILWLSRKRTYKLLELQEKEEDRLKEEFEKKAVTISLDERNKLSHQIKEKIVQFESIINPPINHLNIEDIFEKELDTIGTKFRKVTEKIIFEVYRNKIGELPYRISLSQAVEELNRKQFLSDTSKNYLTIVRMYGNISSHYSNNPEITKEEAISIASALMNVIEEIYDKNLLNKN